MKTRKMILTILTCDTCNKKVEYLRDPAMELDHYPSSGWIKNFYIDSFPKDFCSLSCLHKGIDKYYQNLEHINK